MNTIIENIKLSMEYLQLPSNLAFFAMTIMGVLVMSLIFSRAGIYFYKVARNKKKTLVFTKREKLYSMALFVCLLPTTFFLLMLINSFDIKQEIENPNDKRKMVWMSEALQVIEINKPLLFQFGQKNIEKTKWYVKIFKYSKKNYNKEYVSFYSEFKSVLKDNKVTVFEKEKINSKFLELNEKYFAHVSKKIKKINEKRELVKEKNYQRIFKNYEG